MRAIAHQLHPIQHKCRTISTLTRKLRQDAEQPNPGDQREPGDHASRRREDIEYLIDTIEECAERASSRTDDLIAQLRQLLAASVER